MSSLLLQTELQLRILAVCVRSQRANEVSDNDDSHSNERKGHSNWEKTFSTIILITPFNAKFFAAQKIYACALPYCSSNTNESTISGVINPIRQMEKLRFRVREKSRMQN